MTAYRSGLRVLFNFCYLISTWSVLLSPSARNFHTFRDCFWISSLRTRRNGTRERNITLDEGAHMYAQRPPSKVLKSKSSSRFCSMLIHSVISGSTPIVLDQYQFSIIVHVRSLFSASISISITQTFHFFSSVSPFTFFFNHYSGQY